MSRSLLKNLFHKKGSTEKKAGVEPADLTKTSISAGSITLPIINLNGMWALRSLLSGENDDVESLLTIIWVLRNQHKEDLIETVEQGVDRTELTGIATEIDINDLTDYVAAIEQMMAEVGGGK